MKKDFYKIAEDLSFKISKERDILQEIELLKKHKSTFDLSIVRGDDIYQRMYFHTLAEISQEEARTIFDMLEKNHKAKLRQLEADFEAL